MYSGRDPVVCRQLGSEQTASVACRRHIYSGRILPTVDNSGAGGDCRVKEHKKTDIGHNKIIQPYTRPPYQTGVCHKERKWFYEK